MPSPKSKSWLFTSFKLDLDFHEKHSDKIRFAIWQIELCPQTQRPHVQGYVVFKQPKTAPEIKVLFETITVHLEQRRGTHEQARTYCSKVETRITGPWILGTDEIVSDEPEWNWIGVCKAVEEGKLSEVPLWAQVAFEKRIASLFRLMITPRNKMCELILIIAPSGTGKSKLANHVAPSAIRPIVKHDGEVWYEGYIGQKVAIFDNVSSQKIMKYDHLLELVDRYPMVLNVKGSSAPCAIETVIITSVSNYKTWWKYPEIVDFSELERRITHTITDPYY